MIGPQVLKADGRAADGAGALDTRMGNRVLSKFPPASSYQPNQTNTSNSSCTTAAPAPNDELQNAPIDTHTFLDPSSPNYTGPCLVNHPADARPDAAIRP